MTEEDEVESATRPALWVLHPFRPGPLLDGRAVCWDRAAVPSYKPVLDTTANRGITMKVTFEIPDALHRAAKIEATRRGISLKSLVAQGLRIVLKNPVPRRSASLAALMMPACGMIDSNVSDLGSNPTHLANFGRDTSGNH